MNFRKPFSFIECLLFRKHSLMEICHIVLKIL